MVVLTLVLGGAARAEPSSSGPREVPAELVPVLEAARRALEASDPAAALRIVDSYRGPTDPLQALLRGYALSELDRHEAAEAAYREALALDPELTQAQQGLARSLSAQGKWGDAVATLRASFDLDGSDAATLGTYARAAFEAGDERLATLLVERGLVRFPDNLAFRRLDAALLLRREDWKPAMSATLSILAREPRDRLAWRQLAAAAERAAPELALAALEGATLAAPDDESLALRLARRQLDAQMFGAVLDQAEAWRSRTERLSRWQGLALTAALESRDWRAAVSWAENTTWAPLVKAQLALSDGRDERALELFRKALADGGADSRDLIRFARIAGELNRTIELQSYARLVLSRCDPWSPAAAALLGHDPEGALVSATCGVDP